MVTRLPLKLDTKADAQRLKSHLKYLFGDSHQQRHADRYEDDIEIPETVCTTQAIGTPPPRTSGDSLGSVLTFRSGGSFAMLHVWYEPGEGASYSLGAHAGWDKHGTKDDIREYWQAMDSVLDQLGVLPEAYEFSCPCGGVETVEGGYLEINDTIRQHNDEAHKESRISTTVLINREVTVADSTENASGQPATTAP